MSELKVVCQHLDRIIIEYFNTQEEYFSKQDFLEKQMKNGLICMAKARYSMGAKSVSALQYPQENMTANKKVALTPADPAVRQDGPYMTFDLHKVGGEEVTSIDNDHKDKGSGDGLRHRNIAEKEKHDADDVSDLVSRIQDLNIKGKYQPGKMSPSDPIKWFGVLVPQPLRESQRSFISVIESACEVASLKAKMINLQSTIRKLLRRKEAIINSIDNSGSAIYEENSFL